MPHVIVEIPKGSSIKYEIDSKNGLTSVDNYGFIPQTKDEGGADPTDVFVLILYCPNQ
jgi:inorganic pyrophosphatase